MAIAKKGHMGNERRSGTQTLTSYSHSLTLSLSLSLSLSHTGEFQGDAAISLFGVFDGHGTGDNINYWDELVNYRGSGDQSVWGL
jgi:serine/threonine protein phosphatase PrpC